MAAHPRFLEFLVVLALLGLSCRESAGSDVQAEIVEYGIYGNLEIVGQAETGAQELKLVREDHLETTTHVPFEYGVSFGYRFRLSECSDAPVITFVVLVPPEEGGARCYMFNRTYEETLANPFIGYRLDSDGPMTCGTYSLSIWADERRLCEKNFEVECAGKASGKDLDQQRQIQP